MNGGGEGQPVWKILEDLTKAATVRIHVPRAGYSPLDTVQEAGLFLGSGFLAAPQWVLTCAHVLFDGAAQRPVGKGERVIVCQVGPSGLPFALEGEVAAVLPEHVPAAGSWPAPDLALVRLRRPAPYTCAYLSDRPAGTQLDGSGLYQVGWIDNGGQLTLRGGAVTVAGTLGGPGEAEQLLLKGEGFIAGSSGGPVVDLRRGEVVAVVKSRLREGGSGSAVDLACLRSLAVPGLTAERATPPFGTMLPDGPWWEGAATGRAGTGLAAPAPAEVLPEPRARDAAAYGDAPGPVPEPPEPEEDLYQALYRDHDRYHASQLAGAAPTWTDAQRSLWAPGPAPAPSTAPASTASSPGSRTPRRPPNSRRSCAPCPSTSTGPTARTRRAPGATASACCATAPAARATPTRSRCATSSRSSTRRPPPPRRPPSTPPPPWPPRSRPPTTSSPPKPARPRTRCGSCATGPRCRRRTAPGDPRRLPHRTRRLVARPRAPPRPPSPAR
ncbi:trypsin-like serine peptidase, partial [Streptomyces sp. DfronAA-171]|uniref:trypsin-like serine peptidase n=1 Tax=Streptomyces sp. DfronAA-171 TaxID=1839777 RepID=UPI00081F24C0